MSESTEIPSENDAVVSPAVPNPLSSPNITTNQPQADRIISGIDLLDYGAGGLMPHKVYLVKGGSGVGKTLLGLQYLTRGLELQEPGILVTDQKPQNIVAQAHGIGFAVEESIRRGQLSILNPSSRYFELVESPADVLAIIEELGDHAKSLGAKRLVIDPVFSLINTSYSSHFALSITQSLINALEDLPVTTVLIATHGNDFAEHNPIVRQLEQNAFGVIDLSHDTATGGRLMRLEKCRYAPNDELCAHYRILNGRGLINYRGDGEKVDDVTKPWEHAPEASRSVLLIGAQPDTINRVKEALGSEYQVQAEADLDKGVERAKREQPGLVLVTPQRSVAAMAAILDLAKNATSSIAFLSPHANRSADRVLYLRAGADDFITEPFSPAELRARADALIRRSGRRLNLRGSHLGSITAEELSGLLNTGDDTIVRRKGELLTPQDGGVKFAPEFNDRLQRSIETVKKLDQPFAVFWAKATDGADNNLNKSLAKLCRQEDIVCRNGNGEFVAILSATDQDGIKGFENRLNQKLGSRLEKVQKGYSVYNDGAA
jgi:KaiC/GvpD/RAD55 family RecA-like ATPase/CheY-like chemotaxis protein